VPAEIRLYGPLFTDPEPDPNGEAGLQASLNPDSLEILTQSRVEPELAKAQPEDRLQLERVGYFCVDEDSRPDRLVLNRTATLRDTWAKVARQNAGVSGNPSKKSKKSKKFGNKKSNQDSREASRQMPKKD
jgi:glutaminyl-tRNA synthetase